MDLVNVYNLEASYKEEKIEGLNLTVKEGQITGICGLENSGLNLLQRILTSRFEPYLGEVKILGEDIKKSRSYLRDVTFYFNNTPFYENLTCMDHLKEILSYRKYKIEGVNEVLSLLNLPSSLLKKRGGKCNLYETHLMNLAFAFIPETKLIIMEDPIPHFRIDEQEVFINFMNTIKEYKYSVLIFSPYSKNLEKFCDLISYIENGRIISKEQFEENRNLEYKSRIENLKETEYANFN